LNAPWSGSVQHGSTAVGAHLRLPEPPELAALADFRYLGGC